MIKWLYNLYASAFGYPCIVCGKYWTKRQLGPQRKWVEVMTVTSPDHERDAVCCWPCRFIFEDKLKGSEDESGN